MTEDTEEPSARPLRGFGNVATLWLVSAVASGGIALTAWQGWALALHLRLGTDRARWEAQVDERAGVQKSWGDLVAQLGSDAQAMRAQTTGLQAELARLRRERDAAVELKANAQRDADAVAELARARRDELARIDENRRTAQTLRETEDSQCKALAEAKASLQSSCDQLLSEKGRLEGATRDLESRRRQLLEETGRADVELRGRAHELEQGRAALKKIEDDRRALLAETSRLRSESEDLRGLIPTLLKTKEALRGDLAAVDSEVLGRRVAERSLADDFTRMKARYEADDKALRAEHATLVQIVARASTERSAAEKQLQEGQRKLSELQARLSLVEERRATVERDMSVFEGRALALKDELTRVTVDLARKREELSQAEAKLQKSASEGK